MDDIFKDLQKAGKNDVDNLIQWMKDSKLIDQTKDQEQKARRLFRDAEDIKNIQLSKFKDVIHKIAEDQKKNFDELSKQLAAEAPKILNAAVAGINAFKEALKGK